ncbi:MAG: hypothetical protein ACMUIG_03390 [Thermoplasmatota archaeon]
MIIIIYLLPFFGFFIGASIYKSNLENDQNEGKYPPTHVDGIPQTYFYMNTYLYSDDDTLVLEMWRGMRYWSDYHVYISKSNEYDNYYGKTTEFFTEDNKTFCGDVIVFFSGSDFDILSGVEYYVTIHKGYNDKRVWEKYIVADAGEGGPLARDLPG